MTYYFTCEHCGWTGESAWSPQDADDECEALFGSVPPNGERVVLCDDCYTEALRLLPPEVFPGGRGSDA